MKFIKKLFCGHVGIEVKTEVLSTEPLFIIKSSIKCIKCEKTFPIHPNSKCCYVDHMHNQIMADHFSHKLRRMNHEQTA